MLLSSTVILAAIMAAASSNPASAATLRNSDSDTTEVLNRRRRLGDSNSERNVKSKSSKCSAEKIAGFYSECYTCGGTFGLGVDSPPTGCYSFPTYFPSVDGTLFYTDQEMKLNATTLDEDTVWIEGYNKFSYSATPEDGVFASDTDEFVGLLDTNTCVFHLAETNEHGTWDGNFDGDAGIHALQTEPNIGNGVGRVAKSSCKKKVDLDEAE